MTIPNLLTILRILLTPLLVWALLNRRLTLALVVFLLAGLTDGLDGFIARVFDQRSKLGAYLDPLADKLLLMTSFLMLGRLHLMPSWLVIVVISRDAIILLGLITLMFHQISVEIRPFTISKVNTLAQLLTVLMVLARAVFLFPPWVYSLMYASTGCLSIVSGLLYIKAGVGIFETHKARSNGK